MKTKIHVTTEKHWVLDVEKTICPECQATPGFPCISVASSHGKPAERFPNNIVHARRVNATGHLVRIY